MPAPIAILSVNPSKEEYKSFDGKIVLFGTEEVTVILDCVSTKSGSYERGFKFGSITYGILRKNSVTEGKKYQPCLFSADHGKTWHMDISAAKKSKGKIIIDRSCPRGEFAFEGIQKINQEYYGSSYRWKP